MTQSLYIRICPAALPSAEEKGSTDISIEWALFEGERCFARSEHPQTAQTCAADIPPADKSERNVVLIVPATELQHTTVEISRKQARHIHALLPSLMEQQLAGDIAELRFFAAKRSQQPSTKLSYDVAAVDTQLFGRWESTLTQMGVFASSIVSDASIIAGSGKLLVDGEYIVAAFAEQSMATEYAAATTLIPLYAATQPMDKNLTFYAYHKDNLAIERTTELCEMLAHTHGINIRAEKSSESVFMLLSEYHLKHSTRIKPLNLQARQHTWQIRDIIRLPVLRVVTIVCAAWIVMQLLINIGSAIYFEYQADKLHEQTVSMYKQWFPNDTQLVDVQSQVEAFLQTHNALGNNFLALVKTATQQLKETPAFENITFQNMRFDESEGVLFMNLSADNFKQLDGYAKKLRQAGLSAAISNTLKSNNMVKARFEIRMQSE